MLLITSPGRCGSSLVAEFCRQLGYDPGGTWDTATDSGLEDPEIRKLNTELHRTACIFPDHTRDDAQLSAIHTSDTTNYTACCQMLPVHTLSRGSRSMEASYPKTKGNRTLEKS